ncbi:mitochondrial 2-oxoglutarate/malate carrier protein-like [Dysidea avara]|uniref:mitochondrial 2-oxoglutarate/malate carrier protein-like n=1 Tax=Dysidea avara TaxID=196820 RepID=UPI0033295E50
MAQPASNSKGGAKVPRKTISKPVNFLFGGLSGMGATAITQPLDLVKNRMQMSGLGGAAREHKSTIHATIKVARSEGVLALYTGLSAGLMRQATYTTLRLGIFSSLMDMCSNDGQPPRFIVKAGLATVSGAIASFIATPTELSLIRMTSDGRLPVDQRRGYKHVFDALYRIGKEEGVLTLWTGYRPTVVRAMVVNAAQLASYFQAKQFLLSTDYFEDNLFAHFVASMISGFVTTTISLPVDITKTRIQNMKIIDGKPEYSGAIDVFTKTVRQEGVFSLWKGFTPYYARIGPHTVFTFIFLEQLRKLYWRHYS